MKDVAWIRIIDEDEAKGKLKEVYGRVKKERGRVANVFKAQSLNPESMEAHLGLYMALMYGRSELSRFQREMIAVTVSSINGCNYCKVHHSEALAVHAKDHRSVDDILRLDHRSLSNRDKALLKFAIKLTKDPSSMSEEDIGILRDHGFSDKAILDATLIASYFNFVNRLVQALGVKIEDREQRVYKY